MLKNNKNRAAIYTLVICHLISIKRNLANEKTLVNMNRGRKYFYS